MTSSPEAAIDVRPSRRRIVWVTLGAAGAAALILLVGILPAEFNRDPTGLGRWIGTSRLWAPTEKVMTQPEQGRAALSHSYSTAFRTDVIEVPLKAGGDFDRGDELEYKVRLERGASYVYSWAVAGVDNPEEFYTEFHGHTIAPGVEMTVAYYRKATGTSDNGVITAPFTGVHGWFFQNQSTKPVIVRLKLSGFYTLIPDGQPGNEAGLHARRVEF